MLPSIKCLSCLGPTSTMNCHPCIIRSNFHLQLKTTTMQSQAPVKQLGTNHNVTISTTNTSHHPAFNANLNPHPIPSLKTQPPSLRLNRYGINANAFLHPWIASTRSTLTTNSPRRKMTCIDMKTDRELIFLTHRTLQSYRFDPFYPDTCLFNPRSSFHPTSLILDAGVPFLLVTLQYVRFCVRYGCVMVFQYMYIYWYKKR
jgi:hypothetical protein